MLTLLYSDIKEEEQTEPLSFEKSTVEYVLSHVSKIEKMIMGISKIYDKHVTDDIMSDLIMYLAKCADYDVTYAYKEETGTLVSIENYIASQAKHCCQRYKLERYKYEKNTVSLDSTIKSSENSNKDSKSTIGEFIPDNSKDEIERMCYNIEESLYELRYIRATYDVDIYLMVYMRLKVSNNDNYIRALEACGYSKKEIQRAEERLRKSEEMKGLLRCIAITSVTTDVTQYIEKYIYCIGAVKLMIESLAAM